jgi:hypothetical protein
MRPIANVTLHAALAAALIAFAASSAAASDTLKLLATVNMGATDARPGGHDEEIAIHSLTFGPRQSTSRVSKVDGIAVKQGTARAGKKSGAVDYAWQVQAGEAASPRPARVFVKSWSTSGDSSEGVGGAHKETIGIARSPGAASGQATGKRMHKPILSGVEGPVKTAMVYDAGSVAVGGRLAGCRVGAAYPRAEIIAGGERHDLEGVTIDSCSAGGATLSFRKVTVRGWDPEKKED